MSPAAGGAAAAGEPGDLVVFPSGFAEPVDLAALVDFVSLRLGVNIFADPQVAQRTVKFNGPMQIKQSELLDLLAMLLEQQGFALTREREGWFNIRAAGEVGVHPGEDDHATTRVIPTPGMRPSALQTAVSGALGRSSGSVAGQPAPAASGGGRITYADELGIILITDTPRNIRAVETIVSLILSEQARQGLHRFEVANITADLAKGKLIELAGGGSAARSRQSANPNQPIGQPAVAPTGASGPLTNLPDRLIVDAESNALIFRGSDAETKHIADLLAVVDVPSRLLAKRYVAGPAAPVIVQFGQKRGLGGSSTAGGGGGQRNATSLGTQFPALAQQLTGQANVAAESGAGFFMEENLEAFVYFGTAAQHKQVSDLVAEFSPLAQAAKVVVEFYKLKHAQAENVAELLSLLLGQEQSQQGGSPFLSGPGGSRGSGTRTTGAGATGSRRTPTSGAASSAFDRNTPSGGLNTAGAGNSLNSLSGSSLNAAGTNPASSASGSLAGGGGGATIGGGGLGGGGSTARGGLRSGADGESLSFSPAENITIQSDPARNQVIVKAPAKQQMEIATIIQRLDVRRPQVLIEAKIVAVNTTENFQFAIEGQFTPGQAIFFTNFGLTTAGTAGAGQQAAQATRTVASNLGGITTAIIRSDSVPLVINALQRNGDTRIMSSPQLLVNDNEEANLISVREEPYAQTVTGTATTQTSQGGVAEAGTTLSVRPQISEAGLLNLEYSIELSSFQASTSTTSGLQPPKQKEQYSSLVTLPSDATMVIGGLNTESLRRSVQKIPLLGDIPIIGELFRSTVNDKSNSTIYVFIRPVIIRDSSFGDLRLLTKGPMETVKLEGDMPKLQPERIPVSPNALAGSEDLSGVEIQPARKEEDPEADPR